MLKELMQTLLRRAGGGEAGPLGAQAAADRLNACIEQAAQRAAAGDHAAAVDFYRESLELQPGDPRIWCNFGAALNALGLAG
jgi:Flp pilus assembly protein TadD